MKRPSFAECVREFPAAIERLKKEPNAAKLLAVAIVRVARREGRLALVPASIIKKANS